MIEFTIRLLDIIMQIIATTTIAIFFIVTIAFINIVVVIIQILSVFVYGLSLIAKYIYKYLAYVASL